MQFLLVELAPALRVRPFQQDAVGEIEVDGARLKEVLGPSDSMFLGFFDWLRDYDEHVIGVQLTFHDGREAARRELSSHCSGAWVASDIFRVLFDSEAEVNADASFDQELGVSRIFVGPGRVALWFDASAFDREDVERLSEA